MYSNTTVRNFYKLVVRVLINGTLPQADYLYFSITVHEEIVNWLVYTMSES